MNAPVVVGGLVVVGAGCMVVGVIWLRKALEQVLPPCDRQPLPPFDRKSR